MKKYLNQGEIDLTMLNAHLQGSMQGLLGISIIVSRVRAPATEP